MIRKFDVLITLFSTIIVIFMLHTFKQKYQNDVLLAHPPSTTRLDDSITFEECGWVDSKIAGKDNFMKRMRHNMTCEQIFKRWMDTNLKPPGSPKKEMPESLYARYTLGGTILVHSKYKAPSDVPKREKRRAKKSSSRKKRSTWNSHQVDRVLNQLNGTNWHQDYHTDSVAEAMNLYKPQGQGLVVGSLSPWVEGAALFNGADHVLTATYNQLHSTDARITATHPRTMAKDYEKYLNSFDFVASYSSIEHSGLGRYGDTLDPEGDILEMQKVRCWLKDGGLFYFGVPVNLIDALYWNLHRIYGPKRLPYMFAGFEIVTIIKDNKRGKGGEQQTLHQALQMPGDLILGPSMAYGQPTFVLRKIPMQNC